MHFDRKLWLPNEKVKLKFKNFFSNPDNIAKHSFFPLIKGKLIFPKYEYYKSNKKNLRRYKEPKIREICYASHFDSSIYSWYSVILEEAYEEKLKAEKLIKNVIAYRSIDKKSNIHFAQEAFEYVEQKRECTAIAFDVKQFFDNISHVKLKERWSNILGYPTLPRDHYNIFKSLTKYSFVSKEFLDENFSRGVNRDRVCTVDEFKNVIRKGKKICRNETDGKLNEKGIPQGSPISALLSNLFMINFDIELKKFSDDNDAFYRRYSDDILIICPTGDYRNFISKVAEEVCKLDLELHEGKTDITHFCVSFDNKLLAHKPVGKSNRMQYLGFEFDGNNTYVRSSSMSRYHSRLHANVRETLKRAYGKRSKGNVIFKRRVLRRYSDHGKRNFITYVKRSAKIHESKTVSRQIKNNVSFVKSLINKKAQKKEDLMKRKDKVFTSFLGIDSFENTLD